MGLKATATYEFDDDKLYAAGYLIVEPHTNKTLYVNDYERLLNLLIEKYGAPKENDTYWHNDLYRDDPSEYGTAVAVGHLTRYALWNEPGVDIVILLDGDNFKIKLAVAYKDPEYDGEAASREEALNDL